MYVYGRLDIGFGRVYLLDRFRWDMSEGTSWWGPTDSSYLSQIYWDEIVSLADIGHTWNILLLESIGHFSILAKFP